MNEGKRAKIRGVLAAMKRAGAPRLPEPETGGMQSMIPEEMDILSDREPTETEKMKQEKMARALKAMLSGKKKRKISLDSLGYSLGDEEV